MSWASDLASMDSSQRFALLALVLLSVRGETPANALDVRDCCGDHIDEVAGPVFGRPREVDVARALSELATTDAVTEATRDPSATGKGRPVYEVAADEDDVLEELREDDRIADAVTEVSAALE